MGARFVRTDRRACRVLIVDDCHSQRFLLASILTETGADVTIACDGRDAIKAVFPAVGVRRQFDLILMDYRMPGLDGCSAIRELRNRDYEGKIILLTGDESAGLQQRGYAAGCDDFFQKPIDLGKLLDLVEEADRASRTPAAFGGRAHSEVSTVRAI